MHGAFDSGSSSPTVLALAAGVAVLGVQHRPRGPLRVAGELLRVLVPLPLAPPRRPAVVLMTG